MKELRYSLTEEQLNKIACIAAEKAIEAYRLEDVKAKKRLENQSIHITKNKLKSYRRVKASLVETEEFTEYEKIELRWEFIKDLMGSGLDVIEKSENRIKSFEAKRKRDLFEIQSIDKALSMYIDDKIYSIAEIAETENISEKIVYRDLGIACKIISVYLIGM